MGWKISKCRNEERRLTMKKFVNGHVALFIVMGLFIAQMAIAKDDVLPTKESPLIADSQTKRVLIYTEVNEKGLRETNPHWGVVFKDGKFGGNAILKAYVHHLAFHDALLNIGARPGNNLTKDIIGKPVEGDTLEMTATWPGLGKELNLKDVFYDKSGKGFDIKFGGNRKAAEENNTGCITCLESCWIAISSNANYPTITGATRGISPNSLFKGNAEVLPGGGKPVILIYRVSGKK
jgi:hypothetical protein